MLLVNAVDLSGCLFLLVLGVSPGIIRFPQLGQLEVADELGGEWGIDPDAPFPRVHRLFRNPPELPVGDRSQFGAQETFLVQDVPAQCVETSHFGARYAQVVQSAPGLLDTCPIECRAENAIGWRAPSNE